MSLRAGGVGEIPEGTARAARRAFRKGSLAMWLRDELDAIYTDAEFAALYPRRGQPAAAPWRLALVTVLQFAGGLTDRQAAEQACGRIDWKYALGLDLDDPGFDFSILSEFRARLVAGEATELLLDRLLARCVARGWLASGGQARTDATHVVAQVQGLDRLHLVAETLRRALDAVAEAAPAWLRGAVPPAWQERYGRPLSTWRRSRRAGERERLAGQIGADGVACYRLLTGPGAPAWLAALPAVETLRRVWLQQYHAPDPDTGRVAWRAGDDLPPAADLVRSPDDLDARFGTKRATSWVGYKAHLTETCDPARPHLITHVATTASTTADSAVTATVQAALARRDLAPARHLADAGYVDAGGLVASRERGIALVGPVAQDTSAQARRDQGFALPQFRVDWPAHRATCPAGKASATWCPTRNQQGEAVIKVAFAKADCLACPARARCTAAARGPRTLTLRPRAQHEALQAARQFEQTAAFGEAYRARAGIEGTIAHAANTYDLRHLRYRGLPKAQLQAVATAVAINVQRLFDRAVHPDRPPRPPSPFAALMAGPAL